jgi:7-cyano-7-deazaguanine synthase
VTYVPARNTIFLAVALAWAEVPSASDIFPGVNALDHSGYPDCRPEYLEAFERMANLATKAGVLGQRRLRLHAPLVRLTKAEIVAKGLSLGVDFSPQPADAQVPGDRVMAVTGALRSLQPIPARPVQHRRKRQ